MPLGDIRRNPETGDVYRLDRVGNDMQWVELGDEDAVTALRVAQQGPVMAFASGLSRSLTFGAVGPEADQVAAQQNQFPVASTSGEFAPLLGGVATGAVRGMAARVANSITRQAAARAPQPARQLIRRPSNILGRSTAAGSAARLVEGGAEAVPGLNAPGLIQKAVNQRRINESFARAMGLSDDMALRARHGITDDVVDDVLTMFDDGYGSIREAAGRGMNQADARGMIDLASKKGYLPVKLKNVVDNPVISGEEIMGVRSALSRLARSNADYLVVRDAEDIIGAIDDIILAGLRETGDEASLELFKTLNSRYSIWANMRKGRSIGADGQIMPRTADGRFRGAFGDRYRAGRQISSDREVNDFLSIIREGAELDVGLPSSGTAERAAGAALLGGGAIALGQ